MCFNVGAKDNNAANILYFLKITPNHWSYYCSVSSRYHEYRINRGINQLQCFLNCITYLNSNIITKLLSHHLSKVLVYRIATFSIKPNKTAVRDFSWLEDILKWYFNDSYRRDIFFIFNDIHNLKCKEWEQQYFLLNNGCTPLSTTQIQVGLRVVLTAQIDLEDERWPVMVHAVHPRPTDS